MVRLDKILRRLGVRGWVGGAGLLNYRTGDLGYDHLTALEAPFEASVESEYWAASAAKSEPVLTRIWASAMRCAGPGLRPWKSTTT